ncbi:MAG: HAD family phosphatase [Rikenellaceae bacterium]|nr:HAD family phosphatase [Rikenellaceae bacterium]
MELREDIGNGINNIIFDLGGVLIDIYPERTVEAFGKLCGEKITMEDIFPQHGSIFLEYELGNVTNEEFAEGIRTVCGYEGVNDNEIFYAWCALIGGPDPRRFALLEQIGKKYRIFVLSNTNDKHIERVHEVMKDKLPGKKFEDYFEHCFYSQDLHLHKPDKEIYMEVITETGIIPEETLFVDDREGNFSGAIEAGLRTYHLTGGEKITDLFK